MHLPHAKKALGQHWLTDKASLEAIADAAMISKGDGVLEIGPGTGTLTDVLLEKGAEVTALEFDRERAQELRNKYSHLVPQKLMIQEGDIRNYDLSKLPANYKIVANIPYYLTAHLLRKLIDDTNKPAVASLLVQKEVAERLTQKPGKLSLIAVLTQIFYETSTGLIVPAYLFEPPPKIDSQVLVLKRNTEPLISVSETTVRVIKAGFSQPRKKLSSNLSARLGLSKNAVEGLLSTADVAPNARAQELDFQTWERLIQQYDKYLTS